MKRLSFCPEVPNTCGLSGGPKSSRSGLWNLANTQIIYEPLWPQINGITLIRHWKVQYTVLAVHKQNVSVYEGSLSFMKTKGIHWKIKRIQISGGLIFFKSFILIYIFLEIQLIMVRCGMATFQSYSLCFVFAFPWYAWCSYYYDRRPHHGLYSHISVCLPHN